MKHSLHTQRGLALPVVLIILAVMLISSVYLLKSSNSTTLTTSNLAYDSAQLRATDYGIKTGFEWLYVTAKDGMQMFNVDSPDNGYVASLAPATSTRSSAFWKGSKKVTVGDQSVEYVIHRLCKEINGYDNPTNACVQTSDNLLALGSTVRPGESLAVDAPRYRLIPKVHFVITSRMTGIRGGNAVTQMVVKVGP